MNVNLFARLRNAIPSLQWVATCRAGSAVYKGYGGKRTGQFPHAWIRSTDGVRFSVSILEERPATFDSIDEVITVVRASLSGDCSVF